MYLLLKFFTFIYNTFIYLLLFVADHICCWI